MVVLWPVLASELILLSLKCLPLFLSAGLFVIAHHTAEVHEPAVGAFDHPAFWQVVEAGYHGATLTKNLIAPALTAAEKFLPRDERPVIDGFNARNGIIREAYAGILNAPPKIRPRPFEIILETPAAPPEYLKELAFVSALQSILAEYNKFIAYAPNL